MHSENPVGDKVLTQAEEQRVLKLKKRVGTGVLAVGYGFGLLVCFDEVKERSSEYYYDILCDSLDRTLNSMFLPSNGIINFKSKDLYKMGCVFTTEVSRLGLRSTRSRDIQIREEDKIPERTETTNNGTPVVIFSLVMKSGIDKITELLEYSDDLYVMYHL